MWWVEKFQRLSIEGRAGSGGDGGGIIRDWRVPNTLFVKIRIHQNSFLNCFTVKYENPSKKLQKRYLSFRYMILTKACLLNPIIYHKFQIWRKIIFFYMKIFYCEIHFTIFRFHSDDELFRKRCICWNVHASVHVEMRLSFKWGSIHFAQFEKLRPIFHASR